MASVFKQALAPMGSHSASTRIPSRATVGVKQLPRGPLASRQPQFRCEETSSYYGVNHHPDAVRVAAVTEPAPAANVVADVADEAAAAGLMGSGLVYPSRSEGCGELRESGVGRSVVLCGWVDRNRDMGGLQFIDVRDHTGVVQVRSG